MRSKKKAYKGFSFAHVATNRTCEFNPDDPRINPNGFCGKTRAKNSPYCPAHHDLCHTETKKINIDIDRDLFTKNPEYDLNQVVRE